MPTKDDPRITVRLFPPTAERLAEWKAERTMTTGSVVRAALDFYFDRWPEEERANRDSAPANTRVYACPLLACDYRAASRAAVCPHHGRRVC